MLPFTVLGGPAPGAAPSGEPVVYFVDVRAAREQRWDSPGRIVVVTDDRLSDEEARATGGHAGRVLRLGEMTPHAVLRAAILAGGGCGVDHLVDRLQRLHRFSLIDREIVVVFLEAPSTVVRLADLRRAFGLPRERAQRLVRSFGFQRAEHLFTALRCATWTLLAELGVDHHSAERYLGISDRAAFRRACQRAGVPILRRDLQLESFDRGVEHLLHVLPDIALNLAATIPAQRPLATPREPRRAAPAVAGDVQGGGPRDLLAACVSIVRDAELAPRLAALTQAEWELLLRRAHHHELLPLFRERISDARVRGVVPPIVTRTCDVVYDDLARRSTLLYEALGNILDVLERAQIPTVILKGAYLADVVYAQRALRPMRDLDLLVPPQLLDRARDVLLAAGYRRDAEPTNKWHHLLDCHLPALEKDGVAIELHWSIERRETRKGTPVAIRPHPVDMAAVWSGVERAEIAGRTALCLAPHDFVTHLVVHAAVHHAFETSLLRICDIAWFVRHAGARIDWSRVAERIAAARAQRFAQVMFRLTEEVHGPLFPPQRRSEMEWTPADERVYQAIRAMVFTRPRAGSAAWRAARLVIDPWWQSISGVPRRLRETILS